MSDRTHNEGNGAATSHAANGPDASRAARLQRHGRRVRQDARALASGMGQAVGEIEAVLCEQMECRPYMALAVASGVGYVAGGGIPSRLTRVIIDMGTRIAIAFVAQQLGGARAAMPHASAGRE